MRGTPYVPHCESCSRPQEDTPGMLSVRQGGMPTWLCFDCIDELKAIVDVCRGAESPAIVWQEKAVP